MVERDGAVPTGFVNEIGFGFGQTDRKGQVIIFGDPGHFLGGEIVIPQIVVILGAQEVEVVEKIIGPDGHAIVKTRCGIDVEIDGLLILSHGPVLRDEGHVFAGKIRVRLHEGHGIVVQDEAPEGPTGIWPEESEGAGKIREKVIISAAFFGVGVTDFRDVAIILPDEVRGKIGGGGEFEKRGIRGVEFLDLVLGPNSLGPVAHRSGSSFLYSAGGQTEHHQGTGKQEMTEEGRHHW